MRKPQANSVLKTLHPQKQRELWDFMQKHSGAEAVAFVQKEFGQKTHESSLSDFWHWYPFANKLTEFKVLADEVTERLKNDPGLDLSSEQVSKAGHAIFETLAAQTLDSKLFIELRKLRQTDTDQVAQARRLALLERNASTAKDKLDAIKTSPQARGLSAETLRTIEEAAKLL
jgi:hypothetical protein